MNGTLHGGHYTIENGYVFLGNGCCEFLALACEHYKGPLNKVQKGAWEFVTQPWTLLHEFMWVDFFIAEPSSIILVKIEVLRITF